MKMMMRLKVFVPGMIVILSVVSLLSACSGSPAPGEQKTQAVQSPGQEIFLTHCMGCHMGTGDPPGPNDVIIHSSKMASEDLFKSYIRQPDNNAMPPISVADVPDTDVSKLYVYLKSVH